MSCFKGRYTYSVDEKGRIALPAKIRKNVATGVKGKFVVTRGFERCLYVYPQDEWNTLEQNARSLSFLDAKQRNFNRTLFQWAADSQLDSQSRITVQQDLLDYAGIKNEVIVLGVLDRIELWSPSVFDEFQKMQPETYETVAEQVFKPQQEKV
jgi:MraZ protein